MARFRVVTKHQISGWRFLLRRIEHALVRRDASMVDDPQRGRSTALSIGIALACVVVAGAAVMAFFKPAKQVGQANIVSDKDSGALFVKVDNRLYPALNLSSARLITGAAANPVPVSRDELAKYPRGPWVGIPGAPGVMSDTGGRDSSWAVCDTARIGAAAPVDQRTGLPTAGAGVRTTVIGGPLTVQTEGDGAIRDLGADEARLLRQDDNTWLVYNNGDHGVVRAAINLADSAVTLALGIDATAPVIEASRGLIAAIPEAPPLRVPEVPGAGEPAVLKGGISAPVGSVVTVSNPGRGASYYLVSQSGLVQVGSVLASMIRNSNSRGAVASMTVGPDAVAQNLRPGSWPGTSTYPSRPVTLADPEKFGVTCFHWSRGATEANAVTRALVGRQLPLPVAEQNQVVPLVTAPASHGATADAAYLPRNSGRFVQLTGSDPNSPLRESLFWISDSGVRYGINVGIGSGDRTVAALGLQAPVPAPWSIVSLFAVGPTLSTADARIQHDGIAPDKAAVGLPEKTGGGA
ncbi:type VII secretion protein EccB [Nocardia nova]|uniref:Type VII secretion protein EccB n=1 Tax=Nocardia nova TaxID=37330 RepID=A0A2S6ACN2_9NOCA|nr:type VII secretion protein EccB [Nocardia nova]PPJ19688.1 type VII secretion protein EccB [Nocardia nova]PPJ31831.1 type VII secretion protein EccB [Nocardia nova]